MPVDEQQLPEQPTAEEAQTVEIGSRLSAAREQRNLTLENAASMLHVDVAVLKNLESDNFDALGAAVYVRGHLRKYAATLGLPAEELLAAYQAQAVQEEVTPIVSEGMAMSRRRRGKGLWLLLISIALALVVALLAWWWLVLREDSTVASVPIEQASPRELPVPTPLAASEPAPAARQSGASAEIVPPSEESSVTESAASEPQPAPAGRQDDAVDSLPLAGQADSLAAVVEDNVAPPPVVQEPVGALATLEFEFAEDSWVEVYDGTGQRVLYGLFNSGTRRQLSARGPFSVYLGFARGVSISLDGEPYEVPASMFRGNTARFNIDVGN
jgi:cytoskeleton protein RodZ